MDRDEDLELGADRQEVLDALFEGLVVGVKHEALELEEHGEVELKHRVHLGSGFRVGGMVSERLRSVRGFKVRVSEGRVPKYYVPLIG